MSLRASGILLHPSCLSGRYGIGDLGPAAYRFADFLAESGQHYWQVLPLNPVDPQFGGSPYHSVSPFAGNPLLISPEQMVADGWLDPADIEDPPPLPAERVDFPAVSDYKNALFDKAFQRFAAGDAPRDFRRFCRRAEWLEDFALFMALQREQKKPWNRWPEDLRDRRSQALEAARNRLQEVLERHKFLQYLFFEQWKALKAHCNRRQIRVIGDMPIYLPYDSVDVWAHAEQYKLEADQTPKTVSGVPPDYFSDTGQLWGHPVYNWDVLQDQNYRWWIRRMQRSLDLFDIIRIDHFRGLVAYWEVPARAETAQKGRWVEAPAEDFFKQLHKRFGHLPVIAEDLGTITADVREIMRKFEFPGMRVLLFAFGGDFPHGAFLPHNHVKNCVLYTGTHDNNTVKGWFEDEADGDTRQNLFRYLGREIDAGEAPWEFVRLAMMSVADTVIVPLQDLLALGSEARMNRPATGEGNWQWRMQEDAITTALTRRLRMVTTTYGRT